MGGLVSLISLSKKELVLRFWFLLLFVLAQPCAGQMYEWVDENGQRHFSDQKPPTGTHYRVRDEADTDLLSTYSPGIQPNKRKSQPSAKSKARGSMTSKRRKAAAQKAQVEARCEKYLQRLRRIQEKLRKGYREPQGNRLRQQRYELSRRYQRECN